MPSVGELVKKSIDEFERQDQDFSLMHACIAVDGTARKAYPGLATKNKARFTTLLRDNYHVLGAMGLPGVDIRNTRWPIDLPGSKPGSPPPDLADVIYVIHRCSQIHGDERPDGFDLIPNVRINPGSTHFSVERGKLQLPDRIIFGLLAVAILSPSNAGQKVPANYYLTFNQEVIFINDLWGKISEFSKIVEKHHSGSVHLDFKEWGYPT